MNFAQKSILYETFIRRRVLILSMNGILVKQNLTDLLLHYLMVRQILCNLIAAK
jgi:hypothetical protein